MSMEKFHYRVTVGIDEDGEPIKHKVTLPKFDQIKFGIIRKNRKLPEAEQFFALLEAVASEEDISAMDETTQEIMGELMEAWQKDSGITAGESPASST